MKKSGNGWQIKSLGEVLDFHYGKGLPKLFREKDGEFPVFGSNGIVGYHSKYFVEGPCLVIGRKGSAGEVQYSEKNCWPIDTTYYVKKSENYSLVFFYYLLRKLNLSQFDKSTAIPGLNRNDAYRIKIPFPTLSIQKQIAEILEKADQAKQKRKEANKLTEQFLQSAFIEMFGDPVKNPKGWEVRQLIELVEKFQYGTSIKSSQEGIPVLRIPNIVQGIIDVTELKRVQLSIGEEKSLVLNNGDILFVRTNGNPDFVGRCALFDLKDKFVFASYLIRAIIKQKILDPQFLVYLLGNANYRSVVRSKCSTTAGQFNINTKGLGCLPIILPPLSLQQQFSELVQKTEALKEKQKASGKELENLFNSLMQKAFKGELT